MNLKQRENVLSMLYQEKHDTFFSEDSEWRTKELESINETIEAFGELTKETLNEPPEKLHPHDGIGEVWTVDKWTSEGMRGMAFIPSDGCGQWATEEGFSYDHQDIFGITPSWATHVVWCNN